MQYSFALSLALILLPASLLLAQEWNGVNTDGTSSGGRVLPRNDADEEVNHCTSSRSLLDCGRFTCDFTNPITGKRLTANCVYDKLQRSCLCPRKETPLPCQVHSKEMCEKAECPYAKQTGRDRPYCVWNENAERCQSPNPSFFYMLTRDGKIFLVDPDDEGIRHVKTVKNGVSIAADRSSANGLYITTYSGKRGNRLHRIDNVDENGQLSSPGRGRRLFVKDAGLGEGPTAGAVYAAEGNKLLLLKVGGKTRRSQVGKGIHRFSGDLTTDPTTSRMYGLSKDGVFEVFANTGKHSRILVSLPEDRDNWALGFTCDGRMYASGRSGKLYEIDLLNRRTRFIMSLGINVPSDFASQPGC